MANISLFHFDLVMSITSVFSSSSLPPYSLVARIPVRATGRLALSISATFPSVNIGILPRTTAAQSGGRTDGGSGQLGRADKNKH